MYGGPCCVVALSFFLWGPCACWELGAFSFFLPYGRIPNPGQATIKKQMRKRYRSTPMERYSILHMGPSGQCQRREVWQEGHGGPLSEKRWPLSVAKVRPSSQSTHPREKSKTCEGCIPRRPASRASALAISSCRSDASPLHPRTGQRQGAFMIQFMAAQNR